jgi:bis(5'-nucleosyl)-tetraphosphatase (symmetrical)
VAVKSSDIARRVRLSRVDCYSRLVRWIVGDLQGCARELEALLREVDFREGKDELWCAGDLINRGPASLEVLRLWRSVGGKAVLGNHEVYALSVHAGNWPRKEDTLQALFDAPDADELLASLRALPLLAHLPRGEGEREHWLVHAGLRASWTDLHAVAARINADPHDQTWLEAPDTKFSTRVRCVDAAGEMLRFPGKPEDRPAGSEPWENFREERTDPSWIVHGHWAWRGHYVNEAARVIGLDSGCVYGGPLTAYCVESADVVQVPTSSH